MNHVWVYSPWGIVVHQFCVGLKHEQVDTLWFLSRSVNFSWFTNNYAIKVYYVLRCYISNGMVLMHELT